MPGGARGGGLAEDDQAVAQLLPLDLLAECACTGYRGEELHVNAEQHGQGHPRGLVAQVSQLEPIWLRHVQEGDSGHGPAQPAARPGMAEAGPPVQRPGRPAPGARGPRPATAPAGPRAERVREQRHRPRRCLLPSEASAGPDPSHHEAAAHQGLPRSPRAEQRWAKRVADMVQLGFDGASRGAQGEAGDPGEAKESTSSSTSFPGEPQGGAGEPGVPSAHSHRGSCAEAGEV
mmetsp:Transcript_13176/g.31209  ORF Transcript_13176/g.31209 Transcript_13176/m.31209 type:complete len:233 (+) Transcript_13176:859-1557(+)